MATNFPTSLDALTNPTGASALTSPDHAGQHTDANDAIEAIEAQIGTTASPVLARLVSPTFTGTPTLPTGTIATTQTALDNSTKVATTAFVATAVAAAAIATLNDIGDVTITSAVANDVLKWNGSMWVNGTLQTDPMNNSKFSAIVLMDVGV